MSCLYIERGRRFERSVHSQHSGGRRDSRRSFVRGSSRCNRCNRRNSGSGRGQLSFCRRWRLSNAHRRRKRHSRGCRAGRRRLALARGTWLRTLFSSSDVFWRCRACSLSAEHFAQVRSSVAGGRIIGLVFDASQSLFHDWAAFG